MLIWNFYVIPGWYSSIDRVLYWDKFSYPAVSPTDGVSRETWWYDVAKAARLAAREHAAASSE